MKATSAADGGDEMRVLGVIAEYNPFHNGHAHHLREARARCGADYAVCLISGCFTQRGEPALLAPEDRARMALKGGADAVLEMPCLGALNDGDRFARAGVHIFSALRAVTHLGFGAETDDLPALREAAQRLENPDDALTSALRAHLASGMSVARARGEALASQTGWALDKPNDMLAVSYLRAMLREPSALTPVLVKRQGDYHDTLLHADAPSAGAVRRALLAGDWPAASKAMPPEAFQAAREALRAGRVCPPDALDAVLAWTLRTGGAEALRALSGVSEGLENRLMACAHLTRRGDILAAAKTKRYTYARLSRLLAQLALGMTAHLADETPGYAYVLGFRRDAAPLMRALAQSGFPLITRTAKAPRGESAALDRRAAALWALGAGLPRSDGFMSRRVVIVEDEA